MAEKIAILDCGGQYTKVIDRKVREAGVLSEIFSIEVSAKEIADFNGIILSGGPSSVWSDSALKYDENILDLNIPILGICYGMQLINNHFGGKVLPGVKTEYGETVIDCNLDCLLFSDLSSTKQAVLMSHGDSVKELAEGFKICAMSEDVVAGIYNEKINCYGVQFHPEVDITENGKQILDNFLRKICKLKEFYSLDDRILNSINMIKSRVKDENVLVLVSGGVDSAVTAALLLKALPSEQIFAIHIDNGLMRKDESDLICENLKEQGLKNLIRMDARDDFFYSIVKNGEKVYLPLTKTSEPEDKRQIIGSVFIEVTKKAALKLNLDFDKTFLAQGTLRPDLIESGNPDVSGHANKIKTHHNDVDIVRRARDKGMVIETNWDWHKDEVRKVAVMLGIKEEIAQRQPFPGPGLGVRMICTDAKLYATDAQKKQYNDLISGITNDIKGQIVPIKTVGVQGDCRSYRFLSVLYGLGTDVDFDIVYSMAKVIPNSVDFINRCAYLLNKKEVSDITVYETYINEKNVSLLQEIDYMVTKVLNTKKISQAFAVLIPAGSNGKKLSVAIRAFVTNDFMTGRPAIVGKEIEKSTLENLAKEISEKFSEIDMVLYDVTPKPPATVEWE
ncbi:MAG: glutamine-hydrolyzing GMP synthase [Clostridia bacterium]